MTTNFDGDFECSYTMLTHVNVFYSSSAAVSVKRMTDKLILAVEKASLHIGSDPHVLMYAPLLPSGGRCLVREDFEMASVQDEMEGVRGRLANIRVE